MKDAGVDESWRVMVKILMETIAALTVTSRLALICVLRPLMLQFSPRNFDKGQPSVDKQALQSCCTVAHALHWSSESSQCKDGTFSGFTYQS